MPKAYFTAGWDTTAGRPDIPPAVDSDGGLQLQYDDVGTLRGGFSCVSFVPSDDTCVVIVHADQATIDAMKADTVNFIWIEDVIEEV